MTRAVAPLVTAQPSRCHGCNAALAPFGMAASPGGQARWLCGTCWRFEPSTQAIFADRCFAMLGDIA